ncbi:MAG: hypothetical protein JXQ75_15940 [Phycisphaerae bacterium]|nr:hypothetical protein [Phycisphaerae bacterium]
MVTNPHRYNWSLGIGRRWAGMAVCSVATVLGCGPAAFGQAAEQPSDPPPTAKTHPNNPMVWNVDAMMEEAVLQISRRYNLNKAQEEYTRLLLVSRVRAFLDIYEDDVRQLLKESFDFRLGLKPATPEALMDWAQRAEPVYAAARDAILDGNEEWREILTEDQRKLHDDDLAMMTTNFGNVERVLEGWKDGRGPLIGPGQSRQAGQKPRTGGQVGPNPKEGVELRDVEDNWLAYVETFIQTYKLDEKQQNAAKAGIHAEMLANARNHRDKHKTEFSKIDAEIKSIASDPKKAEERQRLHRRRAELEKPIRDMFVIMDRRLSALPRAEQRAGADATQKERLKQMYDQLSGEHVRKDQLATGVKSRPDPTPTTARSDEATGPPEAKPRQTEPKRPTSRPAGDEGGAKPVEPAPKGKAAEDAEATPTEDKRAADPTKPKPAEGEPPPPQEDLRSRAETT